MPEFRTELAIKPEPLIDHTVRVLTAGSCFADNIGQKLVENKFTTLANPLGVCYNPVSIHKSLMLTAPDDNGYVESEGTWRHFDFHSKFGDADRKKVVEAISLQLKRVREFDAGVVMITYGTSWVYKHKSRIVANCHKRPGSQFEKVLLTPEEIVNSFAELYGKLGKKIIITLSPLRHLKDTLELNQVSKAVLRLAIHGIQRKFPEVGYFPAYEIMMDDLRDYRFYEPDMIHPSKVATHYIWEKFGERYFSDNTRQLNARWQKVYQSIQHRAFNPGSAQHNSFLRQVLLDLQELKSSLDVSKEIEQIQLRLNE